ncbi:MAG: hypothetical protein FJW66_00415 [Actinobacteria bacterium]|nr:hypothetical protein [Actinomycetota bacterium]
MDTTVILIFLMLFAVFLSLVSIIMVVVFLLKTSSRLKGLPKLFKLYSINNLVDRVMKKHDNQYENLESFYDNYIMKKTDASTTGINIKTDRVN